MAALCRSLRRPRSIAVVQYHVFGFAAMLLADGRRSLRTGPKATGALDRQRGWEWASAAPSRYGSQRGVFRPPDGTEIVFASEAPIADGNGLYGVDVDSGAIRTILVPTSGVNEARSALRRMGRGSPTPCPRRIRLATATVDVVEADGTSVDAAGPSRRQVPGRSSLVERRGAPGRHSRLRDVRPGHGARRRSGRWSDGRGDGPSIGLLCYHARIVARRHVDPRDTDLRERTSAQLLLDRRRA